MDRNGKKIIAVSLFGILGYLIYRERKNESTWPELPDWSGEYGGNSEPEQEYVQPQTFTESIGEAIWSVFGNMNMKTVDRNLLRSPQIQAFLRVIRRGEGTVDPAGYYRLFGGGTFSDTSWHPNVRVPFGKSYSTAAGAYQFLYSTWNETANAMGLTDFSPASQDIGALGRLAYRRAIDDVLAGRFADAIHKTAKEWASLPGSPYGQPTITMQTALNTFLQNGGTVA